MPFRRPEKDMFGNEAAPAPQPERQPAHARKVPPGLVPFLPVVAIVLVLIAFLIAPVVGIALILVTVAVIIWIRYQDVKEVDYATMRRNDPWARAWDAFRRGLNYRDQDRP